MDKRTIQCYDRSGKGRVDAYELADVVALHEFFTKHILDDSRVLDVGCGTGRDAAFLLQSGCDVTGLDGSKTMLDAAEMRHPELSGRLVHGAMPLESGHSLSGELFDAVLCNAMLMHVPDTAFFDVAFQLKSFIKPGGKLIISVSTHRPGLKRDRDGEGRLFRERSPSEVQLLFERLGLRLVEATQFGDGLSREIQWHTLVLELTSGDGARPLDTVERILNRDNKVATYKLALFRALAELASTQEHTGRWCPDGSVHVPTEALAEKWLEYYWPLVENGIRQTTGSAIAFRRSLEVLIQEFRDTGGLSAFVSAQRNGQLPEGVGLLFGRCMSKLKQTIWQQPVRYAGGGTDFSVFQYDRKGKSVIVPGNLWRELALAGPWIRDSAILRWGELTERINRGGDTPVTCAQTLECLLNAPVEDRRVVDAREVYGEIHGKHCVWSDREIDYQFDIDHVIPFALWHNNELWNLLPAHPVENNQKRDQLPSSAVLQRRMDQIVGYWTVMRGSRFQHRFDVEGARFCGIDERHFCRNWEKPLFSALCRGVEITASQRGIPRWEPTRSQPKAMARPVSYPTSTEAGQIMSILTSTDLADLEGACVLPYVADLAAGPGRDGFCVHELSQADQWLGVPERLVREQRYVVRVAGESMEPTLCQGDYVIVEWHRTPRRTGQIVIMTGASTADGTIEPAIKRFRESPTHWLFTSDNPDYADLSLPKADAPSHPILGVVVHNLTRQCPVV